MLAAVGLALFLLAPMAAIFLRAVQDNDGEFVGLQHFAAYFATPALRALGLELGLGVARWSPRSPCRSRSLFAYALTRSCMPVKGTLRLIALMPLLAPSLLPAISFIQWFGNQGVLKGLLFGDSIYGAPGIILSEVFNASRTR